MKKWIAGGLLALGAFCVNASQIDEMNENIKVLLSPLQSANQTANLAFTKLKQNKSKVIKVSLKSDLSKKGPPRDFALILNSLTYQHLENQSPSFKFDGQLKLDLRKLTKDERSDVDSFFENYEIKIKEIFSDYTYNRYGKAASIKTKIITTEKNKKNQYSKFIAKTSINVDLDKLPKSIPKEDIEFTEINFTFTVVENEGFIIEGDSMINQESDIFKLIESGLKEALENIAKNDQKVMATIYDMVTLLVKWIN